MSDSRFPSRIRASAVERDNVRRRTSEVSRVKESRNAAIYQQMETERVLSDAKTAKLRALRLAKEESEREAARLTGKDK